MSRGPIIHAVLVVDCQTLQVESSGRVTGNVWMQIDGTPFPAEKWNDFALVILAAWCEALVLLLRRSSEIIRVYFMEGPYAIDVAWSADEKIQIRAIERSRSEHERARTDVNMDEFSEAVLITARAVVQVCEKLAGSNPDDLKVLKAQIAGYQQARAAAN